MELVDKCHLHFTSMPKEVPRELTTGGVQPQDQGIRALGNEIDPIFQANESFMIVA